MLQQSMKRTCDEAAARKASIVRFFSRMGGLVHVAVKGTAEDKESICRIWQKNSTEEELRFADVLDKGRLIKASGSGGTIKQILASRADT